MPARRDVFCAIERSYRERDPRALFVCPMPHPRSAFGAETSQLARTAERDSLADGKITGGGVADVAAWQPPVTA